jgi:hypothetical protein
LEIDVKWMRIFSSTLPAARQRQETLVPLTGVDVALPVDVDEELLELPLDFFTVVFCATLTFFCFKKLAPAAEDECAVELTRDELDDSVVLAVAM